MSTKDFVDRSIKKHGEKYDYSHAVFSTTRNRVAIVCKKHGLFYQSASSHMSGNGCKKCGSDRVSLKCKSSTLDFIRKSKLIHGEEYDYSKCVYTLAQSKLIVTCRIHGDFFVAANKHLSGRKCPKCAAINRRVSQTKTQEMFLFEAKGKHINRYDYSRSVYVNSNTKVIITCRKHGDFKQSAISHLSGKGCPSCARELTTWGRSNYVRVSRKNKKSCVYLIRCFNDLESFYKIGITTAAISYRFKKSHMPYKYEVLSTVTNGAESDWDNEKELHRICKKYKYKPKISFGGETECFSQITDKVKDFFGVLE